MSDPLAKLLAGLTGARAPVEAPKHTFPGCVPVIGATAAYASDSNPHKISAIPVTEVTSVKGDAAPGSGKRVVSNASVRCYIVKNFIRVVDNSGAQRILLRGHEEPVIDLAVRGCPACVRVSVCVRTGPRPPIPCMA
ncbi:MAG: hypothetical protein P4L96_02495 [Rhodoferax sp.]|nr:hypothetical protein [Rhodoferax sp.]